MNLLIENVAMVATAAGPLEDQDILIRDGVVTAITPHQPHQPHRSSPGTTTSDAQVIPGERCLAMTGFKNAHIHAAMTLLRGYGDDMLLQPWLQQRIWPAEAQLTGEDIYWGTRLAAIEMIRSGTVFASDMYFQSEQVWKAFQDGGIRAAVGLAMFDFGDSPRRVQTQHEVQRVLDELPSGGPQRVFPTIAPHSIYTCSAELLQWAAAVAEERQLVYHIHMAETRSEVQECQRAHGYTPFQWLDHLGVLQRTGAATVAAHAVWITPEEHRLIAAAGLTVAHNPVSNMKLASGAFPWQAFREHATPMMLAPDGVASNNNLDMFEEMKIAALLQKHHTGDPTALPAAETLAIATGDRSSVFRRWNVAGSLCVGGPADLILVDLDHPQMVPLHNLESNLVYAANGSVVRTTICDGRILMADRVIPGEMEVITEARRCATDLVRRARG